MPQEKTSSEKDRSMSESKGCVPQEELPGPRCGPLGGCKLPKEDFVLWIRKVDRAVKKSQCGVQSQALVGSGRRRLLCTAERHQPAPTKLGQETLGRRVQWCGGVPTGI